MDITSKSKHATFRCNDGCLTISSTDYVRARLEAENVTGTYYIAVKLEIVRPSGASTALYYRSSTKIAALSSPNHSTKEATAILTSVNVKPDQLERMIEILNIRDQMVDWLVGVNSV